MMDAMSDPGPGQTSFVVGADEDDRLDRVLSRRFPQASRKRLAELFAEGAVRVDGRVARKGDRAAPGTEVRLTRPPTGDADLRPVGDPEAAARLTVLHEDDGVVVVAKPAGMPSQPLRAGERGTAASGIVALHPECAFVADDPRDGGLVHRLDIGTSGVLIAARTRAMWTALRLAFGAGAVAKEYLALVDAAPVAAECEEPLAQRGARVVVDHTDGLPAHTRWEVVRRFDGRRLLRCHATTGRMHQIRVHLATCGAPITGDTLYGGQPFPGLHGFFLHASVVRFPVHTGELTVEAPLPADRRAVLAALGD